MCYPFATSGIKITPEPLQYSSSRLTILLCAASRAGNDLNLIAVVYSVFHFVTSFIYNTSQSPIFVGVIPTFERKTWVITLSHQIL